MWLVMQIYQQDEIKSGLGHDDNELTNLLRLRANRTTQLRLFFKLVLCCLF